MPSGPCIAFFGSTGGCAISALVRTLEDGRYDCRSLVRTPSKLISLIKAKGITDKTIEERLTVIEGNAKDLAAVKQVFQVPVTLVIFGIGGAPSFTLNPLKGFFTLDDPSVCADAMSTLLQAAKSATSTNLHIVAISTTGISTTGPRDVPLPLVPLYHGLLAVPHKDKRDMERLLVGACEPAVSADTSDGNKHVSFTIVRPTLLVDGESRGKVTRVGWEGSDKGPALGYSISRDAVGEWIYEAIIKDGDCGAREEWHSRRVTLTW